MHLWRNGGDGDDDGGDGSGNDDRGCLDVVDVAVSTKRIAFDDVNSGETGADA